VRTIRRHGLSFSFTHEEEFESIYHGVFELGEYDFDTIASTPRVLDCGAHIGLTALRLKQLHPGARMTAFEANPSTFELLCHNLRQNGINDVELVPAAVLDRDTTVDLFVSTDGWTWGDSVARKYWHTRGHVRTIRITAVPLARWLGEPVDLLKLDVEGAETTVLRSAQEQLTNAKAIVLEFHGDLANPDNRLDVILSVLDVAGFEVTMTQAGRPVTVEDIDHTDPYWVNVRGLRLEARSVLTA
jgi:FkbM family methyltransferase